MSLSQAQRDILLQPIKDYRVSTDGKGFAHLESYEVSAHLSRVFGFEGWDKEILKLEAVVESVDTGKWTVVYLCSLRLIIKDQFGEEVTHKDDASTGVATNQRTAADAHDLAVKSAISGALKRCAKDLGDQFGLSLYNGGSRDAVVKRVIPYENPDPGPALRG
jgi:recombination DNA repair RAD52 pathway protein